MQLVRKKGSMQWQSMQAADEEFQTGIKWLRGGKNDFRDDFFTTRFH